MNKQNKIDIDQYLKEVSVLFNTAKQVRKELNKFIAPECNPYCILGINENQLSKMISYFLDPQETHGQGSLFLNFFLKLLNSENEKTFEVTKQLSHYADHDPTRLCVSVEETTKNISASSRRMDIVLAGEKFGLMIENKPWAQDQYLQLTDYNKNLERRFPYGYIIVYLSASATPASESSMPNSDQNNLIKSGKLVNIGYRPHIMEWLELCADKCVAERVRVTLNDLRIFIKNLI